MALSASGPADRVEQLIALTERLIELMSRDTADFEARRPQDAAGRADETGRLANLYRHESMRVKREPLLIKGAPADRRQRLTELTQQLDAVLRRHALALEAAKTVTEGLVKAIAEEAAAQRQSAAGYGPGAAPARTTPSPLALNRRA